MPTDILTDNGNRALAYSKLDMAIPLKQCNELRKTVERINELATELARLVDNVNHIYAHCYITISASSQHEENA